MPRPWAPAGSRREVACRVDVCVRLLGRFELTCDGVVAIDSSWKPAKAAAIVKMLALRPGRSMHRDQLIAALWPEADIEAGTNSLYKNLHQLRQTVRRAGGPRDVIHLDHPAISLAPYVRVDLDEFRRQAARVGAGSTIDDLLAAIALGAEPLLPEDLYEPWTEPRRSEVQLQASRLRTQAARMQIEAGAFDDAAEQYRAILAADDLSEEAHAGLMRAYAGADRRDLALRQYERCREILSSELGTTPSAETEALAAEIRRGSETDKIEEAIEDALRAGDEAMRRNAYADAITKYRKAVSTLQATSGDERRQAQIMLKLAVATSAIGTQAEIADCCRRAASLAEQAGDFELLARALVQFQDASDSGPANNAGHRESLELIEGALARLPATEKAARAMLLAASARPLAASTRTENERHATGRLSVAGGPDPAIEARLREAVTIARELDRRDLKSMTLLRLRTYITSPDTLDERLELTREMVALTAGGRNAVAEYTAQLFRHEDLLEFGDIDGARIQARNMRRLGESIESNGILAIGLSLTATHETADGQLADAAATLRQSRIEDEKQGTTANSQTRFGSQLLALRWHQGRIHEMEPGYRRAVDVFPRVANARAGLALIYAESGDLDRARTELDAIVALHSPIESLPHDFNWWFITTTMSYAAVATQSHDLARSLYAMNVPYAARNAASAGGISFGSAELALARLAAMLGDDDAAEGHFGRALKHNISTRQRTWVAYSRAYYAESLFARGRDEGKALELARVALGDAHEIGMPALIARLNALTDASISG